MLFLALYVNQEVFCKHRENISVVVTYQTKQQLHFKVSWILSTLRTSLKGTSLITYLHMLIQLKIYI